MTNFYSINADFTIKKCLYADIKNIKNVIYVFKNKINDKKYIGQTTQMFKFRYMQHLYAERRLLYKAIQKYGIASFDIFVYNCKCEKLNYFEKVFILLLDTRAPNGYNITPGGANAVQGVNNPMYGRKHSEKTRLKMRASHANKSLSNEHIEKLRAANIGKKLPEKVKQKISKSLKGFRHTEETKIKMSTSTKGVNNPMYGKKGALAPGARKVYCVELDKVFDCIKIACEELNILGCVSAISSCCKGKRKTAGGYHWHYKENYNG